MLMSFALKAWRCLSEVSRTRVRDKMETQDLLITNRVTVVTETKKTQAIPTISAICASGRGGCLGLLGRSLRTQFGH